MREAFDKVFKMEPPAPPTEVNHVFDDLIGAFGYDNT
jgi:hypothetical protein